MTEIKSFATIMVYPENDSIKTVFLGTEQTYNAALGLAMQHYSAFYNKAENDPESGISNFNIEPICTCKNNEISIRDSANIRVTYKYRGEKKERYYHYIVIPVETKIPEGFYSVLHNPYFDKDQQIQLTK